MAFRYDKDAWEGSESGSEESSCSYSDEEYAFLPWLEKVASNGDLFYIEQDLSTQQEKNFFALASNPKALKSVSNLSATEKFKKWMKMRKHKVRKKFLKFKASKDDENMDEDMLLNQLSFIARDVYLDVSTSQQTLGRKVTLAGEVLGLELGPLEELNNSYVTNKIKITGFTFGQEIDGIKIGDWLHSINDENVHLSNIDEVLLKLVLPTKVKLTLLSPCPKSSAINEISFKQQNSIVESHLGYFNVVEEINSLFFGVPHGVCFLKMLGNSEEENASNENVLYKYPDQSNEIFLLKGMFITLSHIIADIATPPVLSCSVKIKRQIVHVGILKENNYIFLLSISSDYSSEKEVQYFILNIAKLFKFQYLSLENAFLSENYKSSLDKFFAMFFKHFLLDKSRKSNFVSHLMEILPSAHWLPLPVDLKIEVDEILNELESSDFGSASHGFYKNQRLFTILGSCFFYKGYLLSNHLQKNDFLDIHLYLQYNHILTLTKLKGVSELIIWKEVLPTRFQESGYRNSKVDENLGRYILLVVAMENSILSILLESGGFSVVTERYLPPEPFYVEEVQNTLIILHNYGMTSAIEKVIRGCLPCLPSADVFLAGNTVTSILNQSNTTNTTVKKLQYSSSPNNLSYSKGSADGESDSDSDYSLVSNENSPVLSKKSRNSSIISGSAESQESEDQLNYLYHSATDISSTSEVNPSDYSFDRNPRLTLGNSIFQYLHIDPVEGIFLSPTDEECYFQHGSTNKQILYNFHCCCMNMRSVFTRSLRNEEILNSHTKTKFGVNNFLCSVYEQGALFSIQKDKNKHKHSLKFWIVGRLLFTPEPREVYVCYHESVQQDLVELAFKLGFGLSL